VAIGFSYRDRDGNKAKATCYCNAAISVAAIWNLAYFIAGKMQNLSNALLIKIELTWHYRADTVIEPPFDSTNERKILLLMLNSDDEINGMVVPSPIDNWESTGAYAGIRLDLASAGALGWVAMLESIDLRTDDNRPVGTILAAGGLAL
jgi:hypothetical protein